MSMRAWILSLILGLFPLMSAATQLKNITVSQQANKTSLYFALDGSFTHKIFTLAQPNRVVIDINNARLGCSLNSLRLTNPLIQKVRSGSPNGTTLRLVFDLDQKVQASSSPWQEGGSFKGIRMDLISSQSYAPIKTSSIAKTTSARTLIKVSRAPAKKINAPINLTQMDAQPTIKHDKPIIVSHNPGHALRDVIVVLDAGHGGKDPGAKGPRNSQEKNVVLAITLKLKQLIDRQPGMRAVLTRNGDYYVGLRQRLNIARKYNGDIFVSVHADAFNNPHSNGASVFALSQSGATSEAARWIAEKENYSELGGVNLGNLDDTNGVVRSVLIDLSQTATINASLQMGGRVLSQLDSFTRLHNNKVEQARFMVLKSPDMPSILVETGFISNPVEERNLTNSSYQTRLSNAIFQGIKGYFWSNPPQGTRIEAMAGNNIHVVRLGETLPKIAAKYHVSVKAIQTANHLPEQSKLRWGQKLLIPAAWS